MFVLHVGGSQRSNDPVDGPRGRQGESPYDPEYCCSCSCPPWPWRKRRVRRWRYDHPCLAYHPYPGRASPAVPCSVIATRGTPTTVQTAIVASVTSGSTSCRSTDRRLRRRPDEDADTIVAQINAREAAKPGSAPPRGRGGTMLIPVDAPAPPTLALAQATVDAGGIMRLFRMPEHHALTQGRCHGLAPAAFGAEAGRCGLWRRGPSWCPRCTVPCLGDCRCGACAASIHVYARYDALIGPAPRDPEETPECP